MKQLKEAVKKRLALYLAVILMLPTVLGVLPVEALAAAELAAQVQDGRMIPEEFGKPVGEFSVEAGQKFYAGDYMVYNNNGPQFRLSSLKAVYESSRSSVAAVNRTTGYVTAKKKGTVTITGKYKGKTAKLKVRVVDKKTLGTTTTFKKLNETAGRIEKLYKTDKTAAIRKSLYFEKSVSAFNKKYPKKHLYHDGVLCENNRYYLVVPMAGRVETLNMAESPFGTYAAKRFIPTKMTASVRKNMLTVTLKKKVTEGQAAWIRKNEMNSAVKSKTAQFYGTGYFRIIDRTANKAYKGKASVKAGSNIMTIKAVDFNTNKTVKLIKGHEYALGDWPYWEEKETVTAKAK